MDDTQNNTPNAEEVLQGTPDPEFIKQQMEGQARIVQVGSTLGFLMQQAVSFVMMLTNNNPRVALAIANELKLTMEQTLILSMTRVDPNAKPQVTQDNNKEVAP